MTRISLNIPYLLLTTVIIGLIFSAFTIYQPQVQQILANRQLTAESREDLASRQQQLATIDSKIAQLQTLAAREMELSVALPDDEAVEDMLLLLEKMAVESGVTIINSQNISAGLQAASRASRQREQADVLPAGASPLALNVQINGGYGQLRTFFNLLERAPRLADVTNFTINANKTTPDALFGEMTIRFYKYESTSVNINS